MPAHIRSAALKGISAVPVEVEVEVLAGLPSFTVVGLTDKAIQESRERLTAALTNLGYKPPRRKTIVSLAPASLKKEGSRYDLPIAVGFLIASEQLAAKPADLATTWLIGELGLDGTLRPVSGILPMLIAALKHEVTNVILPYDNHNEAAVLADQLNIYALKSLQDVTNHLLNSNKLNKLAATQTGPPEWIEPEIDLIDIKGQDHAKRALTIAAAGQHNGLLVGPPGTGKTLLARALPGILPPLTRQEALTATSLYSVAGLLTAADGLISRRPFRNPHYGASSVALIGGGTNPKPGEVSLAHTGVLFLDELTEFPRSVLDQLRQPIEDGVVTIARSAQTVRYPAQAMLIGAMNPCPCGFTGSDKRDCRCAPGDIVRYQRRISGPLLDRFDLHVAVTDITVDEILHEEHRGPNSRAIAQQVAQARQRQQDRQGKPNAHLKIPEIKEFCAVDHLSEKLFKQAEEKFHLSARSVHRLLKTARTIADLDSQPHIKSTHLAEALHYREQLQQYLPDFV